MGLRQDALTDVLGSVRLSSTVFCRASLTAPWGVHTKGLDGGLFHAVLRGRAVCLLEDGGGVVELGPGDVVLLPHGAAHRMVDRPRTPVVPIRGRVVDDEQTGVGWLRLGGGGEVTELVCGRFDFDRQGGAPHPLLSLLPQAIHLKADDQRVAGWLAPTVQLIAQELLRREPGSGAVIVRLCDVLVVQGFRAVVQAPGEGWLAALKDKGVARALDALHAEPARDWSADALAKQAGMSRSAFFPRFRELVGEPPASYLVRWRMHLAARALSEDPGPSLGELADRVGYQSEAAFAKAFKRCVGQSPGEYRRRARTLPS